MSRKLVISVEMNLKPKKLLPRVRDTLHLNKNSNKTEQAYLNWIKQHILNHEQKHPVKLLRVAVRVVK